MSTLRTHLAILLAGAAGLLPVAGQAQTALTLEQARATVAPLYDALNRPSEKDVAKLLTATTSPDWVSCAANDVCLPRDKVIEGFKSRGSAIPNLTWEIKEVLVAGNRVIVRGEGSGTPATTFFGIAPAGKSFRVMSIDVHTIENGKMVRSYHIEDWAGAIRQLGSAP